METLFPTRIIELEVPAQLSVLRGVSGWLNSHATEWNVPETLIPRIDLCLNEVVANCVTHGGTAVTDGPLTIELSMASSHDQTLVTLSIADSGRAFDPTSAAPKARALSLSDATPGGLGLVMMRDSASRLAYRRSAGRNHIDILFQFDHARSSSTGALARQDSSAERRLENLSWVPLFKDAPPQALETVLQTCELLEVPADTPLLIPGQSNRNVYIALSGTVVAHLGYLGRLHAPLTIPLGQCIGELSAIDARFVVPCSGARSPTGHVVPTRLVPLIYAPGHSECPENFRQRH